MEIQLEAMIPRSPSTVWGVLLDIPVIAGCIPGCEQVVEREYLVGYSALLKQKLGVFKIELPAEITVREIQAPAFIAIHAAGADRITGTKILLDLRIELKEAGDGQSLMVTAGQMQVAGKLAALAFSVIKKKAEENFAEFKVRLLQVLGVSELSATQPRGGNATASLDIPSTPDPESCAPSARRLRV